MSEILSFTELVSFSQMDIDANTNRLVIRGWLRRPEQVSHIALYLDGKEEAVKVPTRRTDVLTSHPDVGTELCGFEYATDAMDAQIIRVIFFNKSGQSIGERASGRSLILRQPALVAPPTPQSFSPRQPKSAAVRPPIKGAAVTARIREPELGLMTVFVATEVVAPCARIQFRLPSGELITVAPRLLSARLAPPLYKGSTMEYVVASFEIPADLKASEYKIEWASDGKIQVLNSGPAEITRKKTSITITSANWNAALREAVISGATTSPAFTSVRAFSGDTFIGAANTYINPSAKSPAELTAHFQLSCVVDLPETTDIRLEFLIGDDVAKTLTTSLDTIEAGQAVVLAGPVPSRYGSVVYDLNTDPARSNLPWIVCYTGVSAWPPTGGGTARTYAMMQHLRRNGYRIALIALTKHTEPQFWAAELTQMADSLILVQDTERYVRSGHADLAMFPRANTRVAEILRSAESYYAPQAVIINFAFNMYLTFGITAPIILDAIDVQHLRAANARAHGGNMEDRRCTRAEESRLISMATAVLAIQDQEQKELTELAGGQPVLTVSHALEPVSSGTVTPEDLKRILFVGQRYAPNVAGIRAFIDKVWPALRTQHPDIELHVVGRVCEVLKDIDVAGITLHGLVPSLDPFYESCGIVINPTPYGSGLKIKSVEGLAHGRCVVATPEGTLGLPAQAPLIVARIDGFADAISDLITDPDRAINMAQTARQFAHERFGPDSIYRSLLDLLVTLPQAAAPIAATARVTGHAIHDDDLVLDIHVPVSRAGKTYVSVTIGQHGHTFFRVRRALAGEVGKTRLRVPVPVWLFDGQKHMVEVSLNEQPPQSIEICKGRHEINATSHILPNWYTSLPGDNALTLLEGPLVLGRGPRSGGESVLTTFDVRLGSRLVATARGWLPGNVNGISDMLPQLFYSSDISQGPATDMLLFYDQQTGVMAGAAERGRVAAHIHGLKRLADESLAPADHVWQRDWPHTVNRGARLAVTLNGGQTPFIADDAKQDRLITAIRPRERLQSVTLTFPPDMAEDEVGRWSVFLDGIAGDLKNNLSFSSTEIRATHACPMVAERSFLLELRYQGTEAGVSPKAYPLECIVE